MHSKVISSFIVPAADMKRNRRSRTRSNVPSSEDYFFVATH
jgi:hypothetical protein